VTARRLIFTKTVFGWARAPDHTGAWPWGSLRHSSLSLRPTPTP